MSETAQNYEVMVVISGQLSEDEAKEHLEKVRQSLTSDHGKITYEDIWGMRQLAYPIKKELTGYYAIFNFTAETEQIHSLDETFRLDKNILRHLLIKTPVSYEAKSYKEIVDQTKKPVKMPEEEAKKEPVPVKKSAKKKASKDLLEEVVKEIPEAKEETVKEIEPEKPKKPILKSHEDKKKLEEVEEKLDSIIANPSIKL